MARPIIDEPGTRYGRLRVIELLPEVNADGRRLWLCECDCGKRKLISVRSLRSGTSSCGCLRKERSAISARVRSFKHGCTVNYGSTPEYDTWLGIRKRCFNQNSKSYARYGGRGIGMSKEWKDSFSAFLEDMGQKPSAQHSIDRINNDGNYEKSNCQWSLRKTQCRNTRRNLLLAFDGRTQSAAGWAEEVGLPYHTLYKRITTCGWTIEKALTTPAQVQHRRSR